MVMGVSDMDATDEWAVCRTLYQFAAGIDTRDWALYRSVFADEIDIDYSSYRPGSLGRVSADDWVARGSALFTGLDASQHCLYNPLVTVDGDVAHITIYLQAEHFLTNAEGDNWFTLGGYYADTLVRIAPGWQISKKRLVVTWNRGNRHILAQAAERGRQRLAQSTPI